MNPSTTKSYSSPPAVLQVGSPAISPGLSEHFGGMSVHGFFIRGSATDICSYVPDDFFDYARIIRELGRGSDSCVALVQSGNSFYAVKFQEYTREENGGIYQSSLLEADTLVRLSGIPEIVQLSGICLRENTMSLILEPLWGSLEDVKRKVTISERKKYFTHLVDDMVKALAILATFNIGHFDIKPANILVAWTGIVGQIPKFKLSDFGLARGLPSTEIQVEKRNVSFDISSSRINSRTRSTFFII